MEYNSLMDVFKLKQKGFTFYDNMRDTSVKLVELKDTCIIAHGRFNDVIKYDIVGTPFLYNKSKRIISPSKEMADWGKLKWIKNKTVLKAWNVNRHDFDYCIFCNFKNPLYTQFRAKYYIVNGNVVKDMIILDTKDWYEPYNDKESMLVNNIIKKHLHKLDKMIENNTNNNLISPSLQDQTDTANLKPYTKVLCRYTKIDIWRCEIFSSKINDGYHCIGGIYDYCIPYEGNESLLGTANDFITNN